jgi:hypothetical protein
MRTEVAEDVLPELKADLMSELGTRAMNDDRGISLSILNVLRYFYVNVPGNFGKAFFYGVADEANRDFRTNNKTIFVIGGDGRFTEKDEWAMGIRVLEVEGMPAQSPDCWMPLALAYGALRDVARCTSGPRAQYAERFEACALQEKRPRSCSGLFSTNTTASWSRC